MFGDSQEWKFSVFSSLFNQQLLRGGRRVREGSFNENWFILIILDFMLLFSYPMYIYCWHTSNVHVINMQTLLALDSLRESGRGKIFQLELYSFIILFFLSSVYSLICFRCVLTLLLEKSITNFQCVCEEAFINQYVKERNSSSLREF